MWQNASWLYSWFTLTLGFHLNMHFYWSGHLEIFLFPPLFWSNTYVIADLIHKLFHLNEIPFGTSPLVVISRYSGAQLWFLLCSRKKNNAYATFVWSHTMISPNSFFFLQKWWYRCKMLLIIIITSECQWNLYLQISWLYSQLILHELDCCDMMSTVKPCDMFWEHIQGTPWSSAHHTNRHDTADDRILKGRIVIHLNAYANFISLHK